MDFWQAIQCYAGESASLDSGPDGDFLVYY